MDVTEKLQGLEAGDQEALQEVIPAVYEELKKLARSHLRREPDASLETTVLVHEAFIKMATARHPRYENRSHFYGIAARLMRQVLVDAARARLAEKRGAGMEVPVAEVPDVPTYKDRSIAVLNDSLELLHQRDPQAAMLLEMRYFAGLSAEECAVATALPLHIVRRDLNFAKAWLKTELKAGFPERVRELTEQAKEFLRKDRKDLKKRGENPQV